MSKYHLTPGQATKIHLRNFERAKSVYHGYRLDDIISNRSLLKFFDRYITHHGMDGLMIFYTTVIAIGHFNSTSFIYNPETQELKTTNLFGFVMAESGKKKSHYINEQLRAIDKQEQFIHQQETTSSLATMTTSPKRKRSKSSTTSDGSDFEFESKTSIRQYYTPASLMTSLFEKSIFIISNEGEGTLNESGYSDPGDRTSDQKSANLIEGYDGIKLLLKNTMGYERRISGRTLTLLLATTGKRFPTMIRYFDTYEISGGYIERFLIFCYDNPQVNLPENETKEQEEKRYTERLENIKKKKPNKKCASLDHLYVVRHLISFKIYKLADDAYVYLQPILDKLSKNLQFNELTGDVKNFTKLQQSIMRRGAEICLRICANVQQIIDCMSIIDLIDRKTFGYLDNDFYAEAKSLVEQHHGCPILVEGSLNDDGTPKNDLLSTISIEACEIGAKFYLRILLPQLLYLFDCKTINPIPHNDLCILSTNAVVVTSSDIRQVLNLELKFFHKTQLYGNGNPLKKLKSCEIDAVLEKMVLDKLLIRGDKHEAFFFNPYQNKPFITFAKVIPSVDERLDFENKLTSHNVSYVEYVQ
ncbi:unnamed protein product, partial [Didymodactylos carnosus]